MESIAKINFSPKAFFVISKSNSVVVCGPWEPLFRFFCAFKTSSKTCGFLVGSNVLFKARSGCG